jgi:AraC family transcriptional regulator of adaptative response/methylated-DNA-[protein]-cysteine methyltransferase
VVDGGERKFRVDPARLAHYSALMNDAYLDHRDYRRIAAAIRYLDEHWLERPTLTALAKAADLSPFHFNRLFRRWAGVTPKQYLQWLALDAAKLALGRDGASLLSTALEAGFSGPSRLHDLFVTLEAMTPGEWKSGGEQLPISYGYARSPFGLALVARTARGLCHLSFETAAAASVPAALARAWPRARFIRDEQMASALVGSLWPGAQGPATRLTVALRGTNFQMKVWRALLAVAGAEGEARAVSYGALARAVGQPGSARAIGQAVGGNPVAWLIPCHRVLRTNRALGGYRWGTDRKRMMLAWEYARQRQGGA